MDDKEKLLADFVGLQTFDPYNDWNDTALLEERIMEDGKGELCKKYLACFDSKAHYMSSSKEERCDYILSLWNKTK